MNSTSVIMDQQKIPPILWFYLFLALTLLPLSLLATSENYSDRQSKTWEPIRSSDYLTPVSDEIKTIERIADEFAAALKPIAALRTLETCDYLRSGAAIAFLL